MSAEYRGAQYRKFPLRPEIMPRACHDLAAKIRREGRPVSLTSGGNDHRDGVSAEDAARSLEAQAARWEHEVTKGEPNLIDRAKIGELP